MTTNTDGTDPGTPRESRLRGKGDASRLVLETAPGTTPEGLVDHPALFDGWVSRPDVVAGGLRSLLEIASTHYAEAAPAALETLDPIVSAQGDRLRFEAFSACRTVYARLDLLAASLGEHGTGVGTSHVRLDASFVRTLAALPATSPLHLQVGAGSASSDDIGTCLAAPRPALQGHWMRALAAVQALATGMGVSAEFDWAQWPSQARDLFASALPRLAAAQALRHLVESVRVHEPEGSPFAPAAANAWEFELPGARLTLMLAPDSARGFDDAGPTQERAGQAAAEDARKLAALLAWDARIDIDALAAEARLPRERAASALAALAHGGQAGYDLHEQAWFHRPLPFGEDGAHRVDARLEGAEALLANGAVSVVEGGWWVRGEHGLYRLTRKSGRLQCTCEFEARHHGARGPCKHALAVQLAARHVTPALATAD
jgi:hypothetical protein